MAISSAVMASAQPAESYREVTNEYLVQHSSAKLTRNQRDSLHGRRAGAFQ